MSAGNRFVDIVLEAIARERDPLWRVAERAVALRASLEVYTDSDRLYGYTARAHGVDAVSRRLVDLHALWIEILDVARPKRRRTHAARLCAACAAGRCSCTADPESTDPLRNARES